MFVETDRQSDEGRTTGSDPSMLIGMVVNGCETVEHISP